MFALVSSYVTLGGGTDVDCSHVAVLGGVNRKVDMISVGFARELR